MNFRTLLCGLLLACLLAPAPLRAWQSEPMFAAATRLGPRAVAQARQLDRLLTYALDLDEVAQLAAVNNFFNRRIAFATDWQVWGEVDHWASPLELLAKGAGDCEDYAIAKYFSLIAAGMPGAQLRLVYARFQGDGRSGALQPHMVLAYYPVPGVEPWILDNIINEVRPAASRPDLIPVFSFNIDGLWQGLLGQPLANSIAQLSRWREVVAKATLEGFLPDL